MPLDRCHLQASFCLEDNDCDSGIEEKYKCENFGDQVTLSCNLKSQKKYLFFPLKLLSQDFESDIHCTLDYFPSILNLTQTAAPGRNCAKIQVIFQKPKKLYLNIKMDLQNESRSNMKLSIQP